MKLFLILPIFLLAKSAFTQPPPPVSDVLILDRTLSQGYDWRIRPRPIGPRGVPVEGPTNITINVYVRRLKLTDHQLEAEITYRQNWNDHRLDFSREFPGGPAYVHIHPLEKTERRIWAPDTFFTNAYDIEVQNLPSPNELLRIYNNGDVLSSQKISLKAACPMALGQYPNDIQRCHLDFASYAYTTSDIIYQWMGENPIQLKDGLSQSIAGFTLEKAEPESCTSKTRTGEYSCARMVFEFKRAPAAMSSKLYIIPLLLALLSLLPMIINAQSIVVRVIIGFFCLSTLILHWSLIGSELPKVGYSTGAEVWLTRCLGFIAATLIQLIFFVWIMRATASHKERRLAKQRAAREQLVVAQKEGLEDNLVLIHTEPVVPERKMSLSLLVDMVSLAIFILAFLVFLLHYFTKY